MKEDGMESGMSNRKL